jgi:glutaredoxin
MTETCGYCKRVLEALARLDLQVELVDITSSDTAREELQRQIGRAVVPALRIYGVDSDDGDEWVRESSVITHRLRAIAGEPSRLPVWTTLGLERLSPIAFGLIVAGLLADAGLARSSMLVTGAVILGLRGIARRL